MQPRSAVALVLWLGIGFAAVLAAGCGGSSAPGAQPVPTPSPSTFAIVSGGRFLASGSHGVTFTFTVGLDWAPGQGTHPSARVVSVGFRTGGIWSH